MKLATSADDVSLFDRLAQELDRIEVNIDPYSDVDLQEQWSLCIGEIISDTKRQQSGEFIGLFKVRIMLNKRQPCFQ